ncbi:PAS/PAC sensor signal transduction histidine kinase [Cellulophaga algicola DSM 14237]|uniref:histidine kinase n=1 Tax=Cellulophaga algicola (strain DSM 14237 / IC166 / ACAM 630) TaxID=688270 RepID=E6X6I9_CELAD|nr:PAS domain-containing sensor histidine kinase [Cellulophaga algicola]ADV48495.1 PAS/PAC sensor signal transduction histidine kinase [Cellulophaga algicola DSM 14237]
MRILPPLNYLQDLPVAITAIDLNLDIKNHSNNWLKEFPNTFNSNNISFNNIPSIPDEIKNEVLFMIDNQDKIPVSLDVKNRFNLWHRWDLAPAFDDENKFSGVLIIANNITDEKKEIRLLKEAKKVAQIGAWEIDLVNNTVFWTEITRVIHEVPSNYVPVLEEGILFYKEGYYRNMIASLVSEAIANGTSWDTELIIITANNTEKWVRVKGEAEFLKGKCIRVYGTFQDIHEQKLKDIAYTRLAERLKIATKNAKIGIWEYDYESRHLFWSDEMFDLYQIKKEDFNGHKSFWNQSLHPEDRELCSLKVEEAFEEKKDLEIDFRIILPNGKIRNIKSVAYAELDGFGDVKKLVGANWDTTELIYTQLQLTKSEESMQQAFENSSVGMALIGLEGNWIDVNTSLCNSVGYTKEEMIQKKIIEITHPNDWTKDSHFLKKMHEGKLTNYTIDKRFYHKDGAVVHAILTVTTVHKVNGNLSHFIAQVIDVTPMIASENKTKALLEITKHQNESLLNFAHIVSHNLRSHSTNLSMLTNFLKDESDANEKIHLEKMLSDASESLSETVHHLNEVVHITTNTQENLSRVNLCDSIKRVEKNIIALLKEKNASCKIIIPNDLIIKAVPAYLDSILLNLFTNSVKYSSDDRNLEIHIDHKIDKDQVILYFSDNGQGIDLKRHGEKLFGMYKTFHKHKDAKGIGLFITKNQVEAMNGSINVHSTVNKGTTFIITFEKA